MSIARDYAARVQAAKKEPPRPQFKPDSTGNYPSAYITKDGEFYMSGPSLNAQNVRILIDWLEEMFTGDSNFEKVKKCQKSSW